MQDSQYLNEAPHTHQVFTTGFEPEEISSLEKIFDIFCVQTSRYRYQHTDQKKCSDIIIANLDNPAVKKNIQLLDNAPQPVIYIGHKEPEAIKKNFIKLPTFCAEKIPLFIGGRMIKQLNKASVHCVQNTIKSAPVHDSVDNKKNILIVESEKYARQQTLKSLQDQNVSTYIVDSAELAIEQLEAGFDYDCIMIGQLKRHEQMKNQLQKIKDMAVLNNTSVLTTQRLQSQR